MSREWRGFGGVERERYEQGVAWVWINFNSFILRFVCGKIFHWKI